MSQNRIYLCLAHMSGEEQKFIKEAKTDRPQARCRSRDRSANEAPAHDRSRFRAHQ